MNTIERAEFNSTMRARDLLLHAAATLTPPNLLSTHTVAEAMLLAMVAVIRLSHGLCGQPALEELYQTMKKHVHRSSL